MTRLAEALDYEAEVRQIKVMADLLLDRLRALPKFSEPDRQMQTCAVAELSTARKRIARLHRFVCSSASKIRKDLAEQVADTLPIDTQQELAALYNVFRVAVALVLEDKHGQKAEPIAGSVEQELCRAREADAVFGSAQWHGMKPTHQDWTPSDKGQFSLVYAGKVAGYAAGNHVVYAEPAADPLEICTNVSAEWWLKP